MDFQILLPYLDFLNIFYQDNIKEKRRGSAEVVIFDYFAEGRVERVVREAVTRLHPPNSQSKNKEVL